MSQTIKVQGAADVSPYSFAFNNTNIPTSNLLTFVDNKAVATDRGASLSTLSFSFNDHVITSITPYFIYKPTVFEDVIEIEPGRIEVVPYEVDDPEQRNRRLNGRKVMLYYQGNYTANFDDLNAFVPEEDNVEYDNSAILLDVLSIPYRLSSPDISTWTYSWGVKINVSINGEFVDFESLLIEVVDDPSIPTYSPDGRTIYFPLTYSSYIYDGSITIGNSINNVGTYISREWDVNSPGTGFSTTFFNPCESTIGMHKAPDSSGSSFASSVTYRNIITIDQLNSVNSLGRINAAFFSPNQVRFSYIDGAQKNSISSSWTEGQGTIDGGGGSYNEVTDISDPPGGSFFEPGYTNRAYVSSGKFYSSDGFLLQSSGSVIMNSYRNNSYENRNTALSQDFMGERCEGPFSRIYVASYQISGVNLPVYTEDEVFLSGEPGYVYDIDMSNTYSIVDSELLIEVIDENNFNIYNSSGSLAFRFTPSLECYPVYTHYNETVVRRFGDNIAFENYTDNTILLLNLQSFSVVEVPNVYLILGYGHNRYFFRNLDEDIISLDITTMLYNIMEFTPQESSWIEVTDIYPLPIQSTFIATGDYLLSDPDNNYSFRIYVSGDGLSFFNASFKMGYTPESPFGSVYMRSRLTCSYSGDDVLIMGVVIDRMQMPIWKSNIARMSSAASPPPVINFKDVYIPPVTDIIKALTTPPIFSVTVNGETTQIECNYSYDEANNIMTATASTPMSVNSDNVQFHLSDIQYENEILEIGCNITYTILQTGGRPGTIGYAGNTNGGTNNPASYPAGLVFVPSEDGWTWYNN